MSGIIRKLSVKIPSRVYGELKRSKEKLSGIERELKIVHAP